METLIWYIVQLTIMQSAKRFTVVLLQNHWKNIYIDLIKNKTPYISSTRKIHTSHITQEFHEYDKRSGYDTGFEIAKTRTERIRLGFKQLKKEIKLWKQEMKELLEFDPILDYRTGSYLYSSTNLFFFNEI